MMHFEKATDLFWNRSKERFMPWLSENTWQWMVSALQQKLYHWKLLKLFLEAIFDHESSNDEPEMSPTIRSNFQQEKHFSMAFQLHYRWFKHKLTEK